MGSLVAAAGDNHGRHDDRTKEPRSGNGHDGTLSANERLSNHGRRDEHVKLKPCVELAVEGGYGKAKATLAPLSVTLGPGIFGMGPQGSAAYLEGDGAGVFAHSQMKRDYTCK